MRIVIACGGTGGHFYPGYCLGRSLRARGHEVLFLLTSGRRGEQPAKKRLDAEDLPYTELKMSGMPRRVCASWPSFLWGLFLGLRTAFYIIRSYRPAVVAGMGGYVSFPAAFGAFLLRVPYVLHESNSVLGLANKLTARGAAALALGLPLRDPAPGGVRTVLTGTPVREALWKREKPAEARRRLGLDPDKRTLLVFGGSQGARALNEMVPRAVASLREHGKGPPQVLHLAGAEEDGVREAYQAAENLRAVVLGYTEDMPAAYSAADLVLCRAGAGTIAELASQRRPALLIPYPHATAGHQEANARILERAGAAEVLLQRECSPAVLAGRIEALFSMADSRALSDMRRAYASLGLPAASESSAALADLVESLG